ncbi:acyl-CoA:lysophosphatidylglycerol acyltransferase 1-like isoform X2 [Condylostylus longicornis]|uniref:acyl-CoA:lysophosphatidylglycerol acyltransferase 1-like isoform X2 n=1 Tax=Condylostylus longicornis TaxID=2530218 RepID=UPI00244E3F8B|nr:acyl-CoA:lysophosphatidylglycerol acyltransferase 1-like isoform X2 [Condylostylus longicornis]
MTDNLAEKLLKYPTAIGRFCFVIINNIYCIPTYVVWMGLLLPLKRLNPDAYYKIEGLLFHWLLAVVSLWSYTAGYNIVEVGDDIEECRTKKTLIIANHQSTADVPLLMANFNAKEGVLPNIMWIMDRLFKYTNFGIVSIIHQDFFIASGKGNRDESVECLKTHIKNSFLKRNRKWMVLFPEGGFLRKRREVSQRFAKKNNFPFLQHVTLPRVGALKAIMDVMVEEAVKSDNTGITKSCNKINTDMERSSLINKNDNTYKKIEVPSITSFNTTYESSSAIPSDSGTSTSTTTTTSATLLKQQTTKEFNLENDTERNLTSSSSLSTSSSTSSTDKNNLGAQVKDETLPNGNSGLKKNLINLRSSANTNTANTNIGCTSSNNNKNSENSLLEYILDITIAYPNAIPLDLPNIVHGIRKPCTTYMLYRLYKVSNIPKDGEALTKWLYDRFVEKEQLLERFYQTGQFYLDRTMNNGQVIQQDLLRFVLINVFFITSTYFHYQMFTSLYTYCLHLTYGAS